MPLNKYAATRKAKILDFKSKGLCHCGKPFLHGFKMCEEHHAKRQAKAKAKRDSGLCHCGNTVVPTRSMCRAHLDKSKATTQKYHNRNKALGLCPCGKGLAPSRKFCQPCLDAVMRRIIPQRREYKQRAVALLGGKCIDCGFMSKYLQVFDFHHEDPEVKDNSVSRLLASSQKWEVIEAEVLKCVLLCANCHRIRHAQPTTT